MDELIEIVKKKKISTGTIGQITTVSVFAKVILVSLEFCLGSLLFFDDLFYISTS